VASNTTTGVPVGTEPTNVEAGAAEVLAEVAEASAGAAEVLAGATEVSAGAAEVLAGGAEVSAGATEVLAEEGGCVAIAAGADVSSAAAGGCVATAAGADESAEEGACEEAAAAGADVSPEAGTAGAGGVLSSARATKGCTALTRSTANMEILIRTMRNCLLIVDALPRIVTKLTSGVYHIAFCLAISRKRKAMALPKSGKG
jgi:hypothetical protein